MDSSLKTWIDATATGLSSCVTEERAATAPIPAAQGTGASVAGMRVVPAVRGDVAHQVFADATAPTTDLPGPVPRGAPV